MQILQNPKYTSDLNENLVAKITAMIENALIALSSGKKESNLDQTIETETSRDKLQSKMHHKNHNIKKDSDNFN